MSGYISNNRAASTDNAMLYNVSLDGKLVKSGITWEQVRKALQELEAGENAGD